tara:strand:- start:529 stop:1101 length:573 start_codon:yes stop_codon:yes gene_type:complete
MTSFVKDVEWGDRLEGAWLSYLEQHLPDREFVVSTGKVSEWDIWDKTTDKKYEVKWDTLARAKSYTKYGKERKPTGNLFIEFYNPRSDKDSGIAVSESEFFIYTMKVSPDKIVKEKSFDYDVEYVAFDRLKLLEGCRNGNLKILDVSRDTKDNQEPNSRGWILPLNTINDNEHAFGVVKQGDLTKYVFPK